MFPHREPPFHTDWWSVDRLVPILLMLVLIAVVALRRLGLWRKKRRCAPASAIAPTSKRSGRSSASGCGSSSQGPGLHRRDRHHHGDDPPLRPRAARRAGAGSAPGGLARLTVLGALSGEGMVAAMSIQAATTTRVFLAFLQAVLIPELRRRHPGATVLMDNLSAHKPKAVESALTKAGFKLLYLPRYSPDLSPIEPGGPSSRAPCGPPRRAPARRSKPPSPPPSTASPQLTHGAGSTIAVTRFQTDVKTALVDRLAPGAGQTSSDRR